MRTDTFDLFATRLTALAEETGTETSPSFEPLALELFTLQFEQVTPYRRFCESLGKTPAQVRSVAEIPCVPTAAFKELELTSLLGHERTAVFQSSGTTDQRPSRHYHSPGSLALYRRLLLPWFRNHLLPDRMRATVLSLIPPASAAPSSSLAHMMDAVISDCGLPGSLQTARVSPQGTWELDLPKTCSALESLSGENAPVLMMGTAYGFVHLLDHLEQERRQFALPPGSRVMETGGYKGRSRALSKGELHIHLSRILGVRDCHTVSEYGMTELSSQAYDRQVGSSSPRLFRFPPWCAVQVTDPTSGQVVLPGETGVIRVIDLANIQSVLAIQTEDLGIARKGGFDYVGRIRTAEPRGCSLMHA